MKKQKMKRQEFNIIIAGYGGQGILTLAEIISRAAFLHGFEVRETELHGLAQRGGSLNCHVRFGKKIYSPLVMKGDADLIIALEAIEALKSCYWASEKTTFLINSKIFGMNYNLEKIIKIIKKVTPKVHLINADSIVEKATQDITETNIYMLGYALKRGLLPLKKEVVWKAIKEKIRRRFLEKNKKVFDKAFENGVG